MRWSATTVGILGLVAGAGLTTSPEAHADGWTAVPNTMPTWVSGTAQAQAVAPGGGSSAFKVYLAPRGGLAALQAAVAAVSTPGSAQYRHYVTAAQYHQQYDPTQAEADQVSSYLTSKGLKVVSTEANRRYLNVTGANAAVGSALGTTIGTFSHDGRTVQANTSAVSLPDTIAGSVLTVTGLDTTPHLITQPAAASEAALPGGFRNARPCSATYGQVKATTKADYTTPLPKFRGNTLPYAVCGYTGPYLRAAYQGANTAGYHGAGTTIAVLDAYASPTIRSDAETYAENHGDGSYTTGQFTQSQPDSYNSQDVCGPTGWYGEESLDIEAEHAMAPSANIRYYAASSCYDSDFLTALGGIVDEDKVALVSNSWADTEANENASSIAAYEQVFMQGAMQGISFTFSSGDNGDELASTGLKQVDYPSSDPYVTGVGGTSSAIGPRGGFKFQTGWGTEKYFLNSAGTGWSPIGFVYGAGGGSSSLFNMPTYQQGVVPTSNGSGRAVPDVAMDADPTTGFLIGETQAFSTGAAYGEYRIGGTSLASPLFAGQTALLMERNGGARLGLLNPLLYGQMRTAGAISDVRGVPDDVGNVRVDYLNGEDATNGLSYTVRAFNHDSSLSTGPGWDNVTGVGAPNARYITMKVPQS